ncbi:hypothetical protein EYF80_050769 [Liparis tanakae]|uniref:Uncharacterized protein n=1 Tax=Liparis tanakae TaxID=230148 RepID=A0A4Z2FE54_9TELE|nr:hypothetical protein EYF80_050769 [Liparis tanakae]
MTLSDGDGGEEEEDNKRHMGIHRRYSTVLNLQDCELHNNHQAQRAGTLTVKLGGSDAHDDDGQGESRRLQGRQRRRRSARLTGANRL